MGKKTEIPSEKLYNLQNKKVRLKEKYTFGDWQKIIGFLKNVNQNDMFSMLDLILDEAKIKNLLGVLLEEKEELPEKLYEEDFPVVNEIINDFFLRKQSLMKFTQNGS